MLFTWDYKNVCVVFRQWQITSPLSLFFTLVAVVGIVAGYEALREGIRRYEAWTSKRLETAPREYFHSLPSFASFEPPPTLIFSFRSTSIPVSSPNTPNIMTARFR
jgi:hypothetical protein